MLRCMGDSAHDREHVYRVLYTALDIAEMEPATDRDVLVAACLLHDVGRPEQFADPSVCHAAVGAEKARRFLMTEGFDETFAARVADCVRTHRFRSDAPPASIEAKILFDADKIDVAGAMGIARSLLYIGEVGEPLYVLQADGEVSDGTDQTLPHNFLQEYKFKLEKLYDHFFTVRGRELAESRRMAAVSFYEALLRETVNSCHRGKEFLDTLWQDS